MKYWILKTKQLYNDPFGEWIKRGTSTRWGAGSIPKDFAKNDRVVIWESSPGMRVMALGYVKNPALKKDKDGYPRFLVANTTDVIDSRLDIDTLRKLPLFKEAGFLKAGPAFTIFRISKAQGEYLYRKIGSKLRDDQQKAENIKKAKSVRASAQSIEKQEKALAKRVAKSRRGSAAKRKKRLANAPKVPKSHFANSQVFDRNPDVIAEVLERSKGRCGCCNKRAPFARASDGSPYLEVHHIVSLSSGGEDAVENAIALCPNCHRNEHFGRPKVSHHAKSKGSRFTWQDDDIEFMTDSAVKKLTTK